LKLDCVAAGANTTTFPRASAGAIVESPIRPPNTVGTLSPRNAPPNGCPPSASAKPSFGTRRKSLPHARRASSMESALVVSGVREIQGIAWK